MVNLDAVSAPDTVARLSAYSAFRSVSRWGTGLLHTAGCDVELQAQALYGEVLVTAGAAAGPSLPGLSPTGRCPMTTTTPTAALATIQPAFTDPERLALAGFLAAYSGLTREAYALDLRQFTTWCRTRSLRLFAVRRADIECFGRDLEARGRARATVTRRLSTIAGFYKYAVEEELLDTPRPSTCGARGWTMSPTPPASTVTSWASCWGAPGSGRHQQDALISLLALNGLRVLEATGADIEALGLERGHRTLTITRKGGKVVTIPLAPRTARAIDLATGEHCDGPVFLTSDGRRRDRHGAGRIVRRVARRAGISKPAGPHTLRHVHHRRARRGGAAAGCARGRLTC
jgi:integrase/recombinase XerD